MFAGSAPAGTFTVTLAAPEVCDTETAVIVDAVTDIGVPYDVDGSPVGAGAFGGIVVVVEVGEELDDVVVVVLQLAPPKPIVLPNPYVSTPPL